MKDTNRAEGVLFITPKNAPIVVLNPAIEVSIVAVQNGVNSNMNQSSDLLSFVDEEVMNLYFISYIKAS